MLEAVRRRTDEIRRELDGLAYPDRVKRLATLEKAERPEVTSHSDSVASLAFRLAVSVGFGPSEAATIESATRCHDFGKLAIPSELLHRAGGFTEEEFTVVKAHTKAGWDLLGEDAPRVALDIARYHHERYDGYGYERLKGEDIPFAARIVQVADVYDALRSRREYKDAMTEEAVLELMTADSASPGFGRRQFDPFLLRTFVSMRLSDPKAAFTEAARASLWEYARSDPMSDFPADYDNGGWSVRKTGERMRYEAPPGRNRRLVELRDATGEPKTIRNADMLRLRFPDPEDEDLLAPSSKMG